MTLLAKVADGYLAVSGRRVLSGSSPPSSLALRAAGALNPATHRPREMSPLGWFLLWCSG